MAEPVVQTDLEVRTSLVRNLAPNKPLLWTKSENLSMGPDRTDHTSVVFRLNIVNGFQNQYFIPSLKISYACLISLNTSSAFSR